jgi:hypothetical protein
MAQQGALCGSPFAPCYPQAQTQIMQQQLNELQQINRQLQGGLIAPPPGVWSNTPPPTPPGVWSNTPYPTPIQQMPNPFPVQPLVNPFPPQPRLGW